MADEPLRRTVPDPYSVLGVPFDADIATIRAAYVRIMRQHHPDLRPHDPVAAEAARAANVAWDLLRDPQQRAAYDRSQRAVATRPAGQDLPVAARPRRSAYSSDKDAYRAAFTRATTKVGVAVFAFGLVLLAALSGLA